MTRVAIRAARQVPSSRNSSATTRQAPSPRLRATVEMVARTSWERSRAGTTMIPDGRVVWIAFSFSPTPCATVRLFSPTSIRALPITVW